MRQLAAIVLTVLTAGAAVAPAVAVDPGLARLTAAYPDFLAPPDEPNTVAWRDGTEMTYDDGAVEASFEEMLDRASLKDQMSMPYPEGWPVAPPSVNADPGRARHEPFFEKMYGASAAEVEAKLVDVPWPAAGKGATVRVTRVNGVAEALGRVAAELEGLPAEMRRYVAEPAGAFNWRPIAGTARRSMHGYGAAIDFRLPGKAYRYWRWEPGGAQGNPKYPEGILSDVALGRIVQAFERHGFIWGGKWYHFDTMHFEYRPELLPPIETGRQQP